MADDFDYILEVGSAQVSGVDSELFSVLQNVKNPSFSTEILERAAQALDNRIPSEERVSVALEVLEEFRLRHVLAAWTPWYNRLPNHEFEQHFYPAYRDHSIHTLRVYLLGFYLYETVSTLRLPLLEKIRTSVQASAMKNCSNEELFGEWWTLAALWHDIGYPFEPDGIVRDSELRQRTLRVFGEGMNKHPYRHGFARCQIPDQISSRDLYRAGRHYDFSLDSLSKLLEDRSSNQILSNTWRELGGSLSSDDILIRLDRATTQSSSSRAPFHDHGLVSAALLSYFHAEATSFISQLGEHATMVPGLDDRGHQRLLEEWSAFHDISALVPLAIAAIGYHNVNFTALDSAEVKDLLLANGSRPAASNSLHPHMFFLAVCDTLQDWGRHHFSAWHPTENNYRKHRQATRFLLSGDGERLRVSIQGVDRSAKSVRALFQGWLNTHDVARVIHEGAELTHKNVVSASSSLPVGQLERSSQEFAKAESNLMATARQIREIFVRDAKGSVAHASSLYEEALENATLVGTRLTRADNDRLQMLFLSPEILTLEKQGAMLTTPAAELGQGQIEAKIGEGGFGSVFLVRSKTGRGQSAFKLFHLSDLEKIDKRRLFRRGFDAMRRLSDHPNVVSVLSFSNLPLGFYMDFIPGQDLEHGLNSIGTIHDKLKVALTIAKAVSQAHNRGVLHRDLKPGNVLLDSSRNCEPVLTDFDLAWIDGKTQNTRTAYATIHYGAPEQFEDRLKSYRTKPVVDVYGFGALLYYILTSEPPPSAMMRGDKWLDVVRLRLKGSVEAQATDTLTTLLAETMQIDPSQRMSSMESVVHVLTSVLSITSQKNRRLDFDEWRREVCFHVNEQCEWRGDGTFQSITGGTTWSVQRKREGVTLSVQLNRMPAYEGVNYEGFAKNSAKNVDERLRLFQKETAVPATRHGTLYEDGSSMTVALRTVDYTTVTAQEVASLVSSIARIVE